MVTLDDAPWFVAADVCKLLYNASGHGAAKYMGGVAAGERRHVSRSNTVNSGVSFPNRGAVCVSESGLYKMVLRAHPSKDEVLKFQNWVTKTVLPSIRKDGGYVLDEEKVVSGELSEDEFIHKALAMSVAKMDRLRLERDEAVKAQAVAEKQRDNNRAAADVLAKTVGEGEPPPGNVKKCVLRSFQPVKAPQRNPTKPLTQPLDLW